MYVFPLPLQEEVGQVTRVGLHLIAWTYITPANFCVLF